MRFYSNKHPVRLRMVWAMKNDRKNDCFRPKKSLANKIHTKGTVIGDCIIDDGESERHGLHEQASTCQFVQQQ